MGSRLTQKHCVPCRGAVPPLRGAELNDLAQQLSGSWQVVDQHHVQRSYRFPDFRTALDFTNQLGEIAESEGHHPDITLAWGRVGVVIYTHKVDGLTESDFILAAKYEQAWEALPAVN